MFRFILVAGVRGVDSPNLFRRVINLRNRTSEEFDRLIDPGPRGCYGKVSSPGGSSSIRGPDRRQVRLVLEKKPRPTPVWGGPPAQKSSTTGWIVRPRRGRAGGLEATGAGARSRLEPEEPARSVAQQAGRAARHTRQRIPVRNAGSKAHRALSADAPAWSRPSGTADQPPDHSGGAASPRAPGRSPVRSTSPATVAARPLPTPHHAGGRARQSPSRRSAAIRSQLRASRTLPAHRAVPAGQSDHPGGAVPWTRRAGRGPAPDRRRSRRTRPTLDGG